MSARVHLAWLMWCYQEGYTKAEDRAIMDNWMGEHQDNATDEQMRQDLLEMADEVLASMATEVTTMIDSPKDIPPVPVLGGAVGRHATVACRQGAHDLCTDHACGCRCHE